MAYQAAGQSGSPRIARRTTGWYARPEGAPHVNGKAMLVMCADHGVWDEGVAVRLKWLRLFRPPI